MKINLSKTIKGAFASGALATTILLGSIGAAHSVEPPAPDTTSVNNAGTTSNWGEQCSTASNTKTCVEGSSHAASTVKSTAIAEATVSGRIVGEYLVSGGLTKTQVKGKRCSWMSGGYNSIRKSNGAIVKYKDTRKQYVCRTGKGPSGYQVSKCGNYYWPKGKTPSRKYKTVYNPVVIQSFNTWDLKVTQQVSTTSTSKSTSESWATCTNSSAYGYGSASATATAAASVSFTARGRSQITAAGRQARVKHELSVNSKTYAMASTSASTEASSKAKCTSTTPPPPVVEKPWVQIGQKNDVDVSNTAQVCADYNVPASLGTRTIRFTSLHGSFPGGNSFPVKGSSNICTTYRAPSEVPSGGKDTLTALIDSSTSSTDIVINAAPTPPN